ncbi:MAG: hypothetical protein JKY32_15365 [Rhizobiales bacterium]|nr:hypothetical protein [Hyphomicrobiales bacterium]
MIDKTKNNAGKLPTDVTLRADLSMSAHNFADEEFAKSLLYKTASTLAVISRDIDLTKLDGLTISHDYDKSLVELDRGYQTNHVLTATKDVAIGVAMTPCVMRNGKVLSHMVFNAPYIFGILEEEGQETEAFNTSLHLLVHESAHVEVTASFDDVFPGWLLQHKHSDVVDNLRWQFILASWEEYMVCRICGNIGYDPLDGYAETFISVLASTKANCIEAIKSYRIHSNVDEVICSVYGHLCNLLKYASYFLGALHGIGREMNEFPELQSALSNSVYNDDFDDLSMALEDLMERYADWPDMKKFEDLGDVVEAMAEREGIFAQRLDDDQLYIDIPYKQETMPD